MILIARHLHLSGFLVSLAALAFEFAVIYPGQDNLDRELKRVWVRKEFQDRDHSYYHTLKSEKINELN